MPVSAGREFYAQRVFARHMKSGNKKDEDTGLRLFRQMITLLRCQQRWQH